MADASKWQAIREDVRPVMVKRPEHALLQQLRDQFKKFAALDDDATTISELEFGMAIKSLGIELDNPKLIFDALDVDKSGKINLDELLFAVSGRYLANHESLSVAEAFKDAVLGLRDSLTSIDGDANSAPRSLIQVHDQLVQHGTTPGVTWSQYLLAAICPCYICSHPLGESVSHEMTRLDGTEAALDYVVACKETNPRFHWNITCCEPLAMAHARTHAHTYCA